jgi:hypothetical protein
MRLGMPTEVAYPPLRENFSTVMAAAIHHHGAPMLAKYAADGILVQLGFVDRDALLASCERAAIGPGAADHRLYALAALETALRQLEAA